MPGKAILPHEVIIIPSGKITLSNDKRPGNARTVVYQRVGRGFGNVRQLGNRDLQLRRHAPQQDPRRPLQLAGRRRIAAAIRAYQALDQPTRHAYKTRAQGLVMSGYNLFIREFCLQHPREEFMEDRVKLEFYGSAGAIARPFTALKYYILER